MNIICLVKLERTHLCICFAHDTATCVMCNLSICIGKASEDRTERIMQLKSLVRLCLGLGVMVY